MEPSCLDGYMEIGSWNPRCCALGIVVLEEVIHGVEARCSGTRQGNVHDEMTLIYTSMLC